MSVTFKNAPLVELIAELRWGEHARRSQLGTTAVMQGMGPDLDQFFMRLGGEVYQHGFQRAERLVPPGFPVFPFQPVFRYRRDVAGDNSVLFQAGSGLFSVNAVPPYRSWETVSPVVRTGVIALLKARSSNEHDAPFAITSLRYINAFGPNLTSNRSIDIFIEEVLGFSIRLPESITSHVRPGSRPRPHVQFSFPLDSGASMALLLGDGTVNNSQAIVFDMTVTRDEPVAPNADAVMTALTNARNVIHTIFVDLTKPIHGLLEPVEDEAGV